MKTGHITKISGLNTVDDPVDIGYDPNTGISEAQVIVDCQITNKMRPGRAPGYSQLQSGNFHSLFRDGGDAFVGKDAQIHQVASDGSIRGVRANLSGDRISFCQVANWTFYCNGTQNGRIENGVSSSWPIDIWTGPVHDALVSPAPVGHLLAYNHSRIFIAVDDTIYWSLPNKYGSFIMDFDHWRYPSKILMMAPVEGGMFISDSQRTYFRAGRNPGQATEHLKASFPAYEWSMATEMVEGLDIGREPGLHRFWVSPEGLMSGSPNGVVNPETRNKIIYPEDGQSGASGPVGYHLYHSIT